MRENRKWLGVMSICMSLALSLNSVDVSAAKKWHPGHYMLNWGGAGLKPLNKIFNQPNFKGAEVLHAWREIETGKGVYNFNPIVNELSYLQAHNKRLFLYVMDRTWGAKWAPCVPDYMLKDPVYKGGQSVVYNRDGTVNQCMAKMWVPAVMDRVIALHTALGKRFDAEPYFEGVQTSENSISNPGTNAGDYTISAHTAQLKRQMQGLANAYPHSQVFQHLNWGAQEIAQLFPYAKSLGIGVGGPDILPTHPTEAYPYYPKYYGQMPLAIDGENGVVAKYLINGTVDFNDLFTFSVTNPAALRTNYVIWSSSENSYWSFDNKVAPVVNQYKGFINRNCPLNIQCQ